MQNSIQSYYNKRRLTLITLVYWFLLVYIVAALIWWFIALGNQNKQMFTYRLNQLKQTSSLTTYNLSLIEDERKRKISQYVGEGVTFLLIIILGAVFVYRSVRKQIYLSQQQQNFMMAVTHEFKTPIAVINLSLETLQKRKLDIEQQHKIIEHSLQEVTRLNTLTNNILVTSQLESGNYTISKEQIDFSDLIQQEIKQFSNRYLWRIINTDIQPGIATTGEQLLLQLLFSNLLDNALKYSAEDKAVQVILKIKQRTIILQVIDDGEGIDANEKKRIFDKFYRTGNEVTRKTQGTGLGLYLCKRIIKDHEGRIWVESNKPHGTIFTVVLHAA